MALEEERRYEAARAAVRRTRAAFPAAWRRASRRTLVSWLP